VFGVAHPIRFAVTRQTAKLLKKEFGRFFYGVQTVLQSRNKDLLFTFNRMVTNASSLPGFLRKKAERK